MSAIAPSADGAYIFMALEDSSGFPVVVKASRDDLSTWDAAYNPGAGTAVNVASVPGNHDLMLLYGNFGSGVQVIKHVISSVTNTNISPTGLTTKVINALACNPGDANEVWLTVNIDQDLLQTIDLGANWTTLNAALGFDPTDLLVFFSGSFEYSTLYFCGAIAAVAELRYSPNEANTLSDITGAALGASANIVGLAGVEA